MWARYIAFATCGDESRHPCRRMAAGSGFVTRDAALVHLVDLLGIEEFARVLQVHLLAHEDVEEIGVDMPVTSYATWRLEARQFFSDVSDDFLVLTTGLAIRFGGGLK